MSNSLRSIVLLAILCLSATAAADPFHDAYQRGLAAFKAKQYAEARTEFLSAYGLRPEPIILFNIAQTYRLEQNVDQALDYYRWFLAQSQIAQDLREEAQSLVAELEAQQKARGAQQKIDLEAGPKERDGTPVRVATPPMDRPSPPVPASRPSAPEGAPADEALRGSGRMWSTRRKIAVGMAAGGMLALPAGAVLGLSSKSQRRDALDLCPDPQIGCDNAVRANKLIRSSRTRAIEANVAFGVGTVATIAAGVLWVTGAPESSGRIALVPTASPDQIAVIASGWF